MLAVAVVPDSRRRNDGQGRGRNSCKSVRLWRGQLLYRFVLSYCRCYQIGEGIHLICATYCAYSLPHTGHQGIQPVALDRVRRGLNPACLLWPYCRAAVARLSRRGLNPAGAVRPSRPAAAIEFVGGV